MRKDPEILVLGSLLYDTIFRADRLPRKGETVAGYKSGNFAGGKGANQAVQAAKLGAAVSMIGRMGQDPQGDFVERSLKAAGVDTGYILRNGEYQTGDDAIHVDANGDNAIVICPHANLYIVREQIDAAAEDFKKAKIFLTQFETNTDMVLYSLKLARESGAVTILNPAPAVEVDPEIFKYADYITPNETETEYFCGMSREGRSVEEWAESCSRRFIELGAGNVVITLGEKGAYYYSENKKFMTPSYSIKAVDTTAAGDSFNAGFACSLGWGSSEEKAVAYGCVCGALTARKEGAQEALPRRDEVESFIDLNRREKS